VGSHVPGDPTAPELLEAPGYPSKWHAEQDPSCSPYCYAYNHLAVPFDLTIRSGPSFLVGGNRFDEVLKTGIALQLCGRGFCYDADYAGAWTIEMGIASILNPSDESVAVIRRVNDIQVRTIGADDPEVVSEYGITFLRRLYVQGALGREWYWHNPGLECSMFLLGFDAGGRIGKAHAQLRAVRRTFTPAIDLEDIFEVTDREKYHENETMGGIFAGVNAWVIYPKWGYDCMFGLRCEISRDWLAIVDGDKTLDQVQLLLVAGVRF
jgi:hypothetical protein